jgi:misacylated tRNA(Ala) deacylase
MPVAPQNKDVLDDTLNRLIACNFAVSDEWITDAELEAQQDLVKSMSVAPPKGTGKVRLVRIGMDENTADIQACGGTHVSNTSEIGRVRIGKIEKKGQLNRRVYLHLEGP